jgi:hypothetical protein
VVGIPIVDVDGKKVYLTCFVVEIGYYLLHFGDYGKNSCSMDDDV